MRSIFKSVIRMFRGQQRYIPINMTKQAMLCAHRNSVQGGRERW